MRGTCCWFGFLRSTFLPYSARARRRPDNCELGIDRLSIREKVLEKSPRANRKWLDLVPCACRIRFWHHSLFAPNLGWNFQLWLPGLVALNDCNDKLCNQFRGDIFHIICQWVVEEFIVNFKSYANSMEDIAFFVKVGSYFLGCCVLDILLPSVCLQMSLSGFGLSL